jgi:purine-nucleoside phosphorylase
VAAAEYNKAKRAAAFIRKESRHRPSVGLILGSGLGAFADSLRQAVRIPYQKIPHFPVSTAVGHAGRLVVGLSGKVPSSQRGC